MGMQATDTPGMWADPDWDGASPATFAVLIGVSAYRHLKDGTTPVSGTEPWIREAISLGQLYVSALTARRMLDWLSQDYRMASAPLARCWLLTAPTQEELSFAPKLNDNVLEPTLHNCRSAIRAWANAPDSLPPEAQKHSRSIFFFSGHGIQSTVQNQMLLPSDYLGNDGYADFNDAISSFNIRMGMKSVKVGVRYYFLDACRNDGQALREQNFKGTNILTVKPSRKTYQQIAFDAVLNATTASKKAWQPKRPKDGATIFGQALLEGLRGAPEVNVTEAHGESSIRFLNLFPFVRLRVPALIRKSGSNAVQDVTPLMEHDIDGVVTELDIDPEEEMASGFGGAVESSVQAEAFEDDGSEDDDLYLMDTSDTYDEDDDVFRATGAAAQGEGLLIVDRQELEDRDLQAGGWANDFDVGHRLFGHESVTALFSSSLRVAALQRPGWLDPTAMRLLRVDRITRSDPDSDSLVRYRIRLVIDAPDSRGHWLQLSNFGLGAAGLFLPFDASATGRAAFDLDVTMDLEDTYQITHLDAVPWQKYESAPLWRAAEMWRKYQNADLRGALDRMDAGELRDLVQGKLASPLAATIAATVLMRANRLDLIGDWVRNLADWFLHLPDGPILWAEQLWRQGQGDAETVKEVARYLIEASERGMPMTCDAMSYADALLSQLVLEQEVLAPETMRSLTDMADKLRRVLRLSRPGGLFCAYFNFDANSQPLGTTNESVGDSASGDFVDVEFVADGVLINGIFLPRRG